MSLGLFLCFQLSKHFDLGERRYKRPHVHPNLEETSAASENGGDKEADDAGSDCLVPLTRFGLVNLGSISNRLVVGIPNRLFTCITIKGLWMRRSRPK